MHRRSAAVLLLLASMTQLAPAQEAVLQRKTPPARKEYLGRQIAPTMHHAHAEWLTRDEREQEEHCSEMLANLGVKPGMTVCDMGCGNGYYTLRLADMVGMEGQVLAVDIQSEMLAYLRDRLEGAGIENVVPILGSVHNPRLPRDSVDLVLLVDVYHEFSHPQEMLRAMRRALKPDGVLVFLEFRAEDPSVPIRPLHKMSEAQIHKELEANGFRRVRRYDELPWQHMLIFGKDPG